MPACCSPYIDPNLHCYQEFVEASLPAAPSGAEWRLAGDTSLQDPPALHNGKYPELLGQHVYGLAPWAGIVLVANAPVPLPVAGVGRVAGAD